MPGLSQCLQVRSLFCRAAGSPPAARFDASGPATLETRPRRMNAAPTPNARPAGSTAVLVLADGGVFWGGGVGAEGIRVGEICFNTSMTGYQEIMTDPSYAGQIITFTFPHIGNVGANREDVETTTPAARGLVVRTPITAPANYRATQSLDTWLKHNGLIGISGVDTRRLTRHIRKRRPP